MSETKVKEAKKDDGKGAPAKAQAGSTKQQSLVEFSRDMRRKRGERK